MNNWEIIGLSIFAVIAIFAIKRLYWLYTIRMPNVSDTNFRIDSTGWKEQHIDVFTRTGERTEARVRVSPAIDGFMEGEVIELIDYPFE